MSTVSDVLKNLVKDLVEGLQTEVSPALNSMTKISIGTASHEAGHAILAWCCTHVPSVKKVQMITPIYGLTTHDFAEPISHDGAWGLIVIMLAGLAGEGLATMSYTVKGSESDLLAARALAERLALEGKARDMPWGPIEKDATRTDIAALYKDRPTGATAEILNLCYRKARQVIKARRAVLDRLSVELSARGFVDEAGLEQIFGKRLVYKLCAGKRPIFV